MVILTLDLEDLKILAAKELNCNQDEIEIDPEIQELGIRSDMPALYLGIDLNKTSIKLSDK